MRERLVHTHHRGTRFESAMRDDAEWNVSLNTSGQRTTVTARWLVNCAGHGAHAVATTIEGYQASYPDF